MKEPFLLRRICNHYIAFQASLWCCLTGELASWGVDVVYLRELYVLYAAGWYESVVPFNTVKVIERV